MGFQEAVIAQRAYLAFPRLRAIRTCEEDSDNTIVQLEALESAWQHYYG
jgi:hypothetical protein